MDKLKELRDSIAQKVGARSGQYHANLLGESLPDLLRKATAKTLVTPDEVINQQVVDTIQQEVASGKDTKDIVGLLKKRLRTDNPQKQWLAVQLLDKVMPECSNVLGMHQEELLQEVAKVMTKPAKPETDAGKAARHAAKELLRKFGRAGTSAFRAAHQEVYGRAGQHPAQGIPVGAIPYGYSAADYGGVGGVPPDGGLSVERQSLAEEIQLLIDKARSNTELLSDMLVNASGSRDEFEQELINDLLSEVVELRGLFDAYLEQLQAVGVGQDMEMLMMQALEATDMLDGCITLQKDVSGNQELPASTSGGATSPSAATAAAAAAAAAAPAAAAAKPAPRNDDLIALDDLNEGLMQTTISTPAMDPFAASAPTPGAPSQASEPLPQGKPAMKSAFESMFAAPGAAATYNTLSSAAAPPASGASGPPAAAAAPAPGAGPYQSQPPAQPSPYAGPTGYGGYGAPPGQYGAPASGQPQYGGYGQPGPQYAMQPTGQGYGAPPPQYPPTPGMPYGAGSGYAASPYSMPAAAQAYGGAAPGNNPFGAPAPGAPGSRGPSDGGGFGMPMPPPGLMGAAMPMTSSSNNPFGAPMPSAASQGGAKVASQQQQASLDQEWNLFFADRAGAGATAAAPAGAAHTAQQINADFDALVAKPTAAR